MTPFWSSTRGGSQLRLIAVALDAKPFTLRGGVSGAVNEYI